MNKHEKRVLSVLKTKAKQLGFSRNELKGIAAKIANDLDLAEDASEEDVDSAINEAVDNAMDFLKYSQSAAQRAISNYKKEHEDNSDDDDEEGDDPTKNQRKEKKSDEDKKDDDTPAWAKSLMDSVKAMSERVSGLEQGNVSKSRRSRLEKELKDTGKFGERRLKEFDRIKDTFKTEEDFDEYIDELKEDLEAYKQEMADAGLSILTAPGATSPSQNKTDKDEDEKLADKELEELAKQF